MVWPALLPPWKRTTISARFDSQSMILPLPSSPHWAPITVTLDMDIPYPEEAAQPVGARARWGLIAGVGKCVRDHPPQSPPFYYLPPSVTARVCSANTSLRHLPPQMASPRGGRKLADAEG